MESGTQGRRPGTSRCRSEPEVKFHSAQGCLLQCAGRKSCVLPHKVLADVRFGSLADIKFDLDVRFYPPKADIRADMAEDPLLSISLEWIARSCRLCAEIENSRRATTVANRPTINPCRRTQSPVTRDSNVATIRPHAVNKTKYGTNRPVITHAAAKVLKNMARNLRRSLSAALPMVLSPSRCHRRYTFRALGPCFGLGTPLSPVRRRIVSAQTSALIAPMPGPLLQHEMLADVRFGSKADISSDRPDVH